MIKNFLRLRETLRSGPKGPEAVRSVFIKFRRILDLNTKILEKMGVMERVLGGEYIFDRAFLERSVREVSDLVYQVVYSINALSHDQYVELFDRFQEIKAVLENILEGGLGPYGNRLALPYSLIHWEMDLLVGAENACLAEIRHHLSLPAPDGFVITATAYQLFMEENDLFSRIHKVRSEIKDVSVQKAQIQKLFTEAHIPKKLRQAVRQELHTLLERLGGEVSLVVRGSVISANSAEASGVQEIELLKVKGQDIFKAYKTVTAGCFLNMAFGHNGANVQTRDFTVAVAVQEMIKARVSGTIYTRGPSARRLRGLLVITAAMDSEKGSEERYVLQSSHPFELVESLILPKPLQDPLPDRLKSLDMLSNGLRRGSALLQKQNLEIVAGMAVTIERAFGVPQKVRWAQDDRGRLFVLQALPLAMSTLEPISEDKLQAELKRAKILLQGGEAAQIGVAAGRVVHVSEYDDPESFPIGAIAVARYASPRLSVFLPRAAALITEVGTSAGHLATIAREFRVPSIVGAKGATQYLVQGMEVTVDAEECRVYQGLVEALLQYRSSGMELYPTDPEYKALRQLLRWIIPLNLMDPESPSFTPENCRTFHDIIHFAHERAVAELLNLHLRYKQIRGLAVRPLALKVPLNIHILDINGGLSPSSGREIQPQEVLSIPFRALIKGLSLEEVWDQVPVPVTLKDIISGLDRTSAILSNRPEYVGQNLAIIAKNYLNLSLRLGYHFNVVDAYLSENITANYIYFRFVGGFADPERRRRRAELIKLVLESMGLAVTTEGDLVVGKLNMTDSAYMETILVRLGELIGFTRQLDVRLVSEQDIDEFFQLFIERTRRALLKKEAWT